jgi:hypothetical protein
MQNLPNESNHGAKHWRNNICESRTLHTWILQETHDVCRSEKTKPRMFIESEKKKVIMPLK